MLKMRVNTRQNYLIVFALALYAAWFFHAFLGPGLPLFFDAHSHLARNAFAYQSIAEGQFPGWTFDWYGGYRFAEFYGPVYYWLNGLIAFLSGKLVFATKLILYVCLIVSVLGFYSFLRALTISPALALGAAILYSCMPVFNWVIGTIGNYPSCVLIAVTPWLCRATVCYITNNFSQQRYLRFVLINTFFLSVACSAHFSNAIVNLPSLLLFQCVSLVAGCDGNNEKVSRVKTLFLSGALTFFLTAFVWLPAVLDLDQVAMKLSLETPPPFHFDRELLLRILGLQGFSWTSTFVRSHGALWSAIAVLSVVASMFVRQPAWKAIGFATLATIVLAEFSDRAIILLSFYFSALIALMVRAISVCAVARFHPKIAASFGGFFLLGSLVTCYQSGPPNPHFEAVDKYEKLQSSLAQISSERASASDVGRIFDVTPQSISMDGFYGQSSFLPYLTDREIVFGAFPQGAPKASEVMMAMFSRWFGICTRKPGEPVPVEEFQFAIDILRLANVSYLLDTKGVCKLSEDEQHTLGLASVKFGYAVQETSPILFAPQIESVEKHRNILGPEQNTLLNLLVERWHRDPETPGMTLHKSLQSIARTRFKEDWRPLMSDVKALELDAKSSKLRTIFVVGVESRQSAAVGGQADYRFIGAQRSLNRVDIDATSSVNAFARLSYAYDEDLRVLLDNKPARFFEDAMGMGLVMEFPAGKHRVTILAPEMIMQKVLAVMFFVELAIIALLLSRLPR